MIRRCRRVRMGSSPRVRGKRIDRLGRSLSDRLIPACAGKTVSRVPSSEAARAHPRVCGENVAGGVELDSGPGSSPRVRGKPERPITPEPGGGLIPACAGKTNPRFGGGVNRRAHPRVCGENRGAARRAHRLGGSSPRVRGKRRVGRGSRRLVGLIPACAGKTYRQQERKELLRAHPRVCGENPILVLILSHHVGSSPRVRGKP